MAVTAQRQSQAVALPGRLIREQPGQVARLLAADGLRDDLGGGLAYPRQRLQGPVTRPALDLALLKALGNLRGAAERPYPVGRRAAALQLERDLPQRLYRIHPVHLPSHTPRRAPRFTRALGSQGPIHCASMRITTAVSVSLRRDGQADAGQRGAGGLDPTSAKPSRREGRSPGVTSLTR